MMQPEANSTGDKKMPSPSPEERMVNNLFFGVVLVATTLIAVHCGLVNLQSPAVALLWVMACLAVGATVGFLFGLTRVGQATEKEAQEKKDSGGKYKPAINSNLIEISDWLTKIIVGLGLINLKEIPEKLRHIAQALADCLGGSCGFALALAIIIGFTSIGFLFGYINTRTIVARVLDAADRSIVDPEKERIKGLLELAESRVKTEADSVTADTQKQALQTGGATPPIPAKTGPEHLSDAKLDKMAEEYRKIESPDYRERVIRKDKAASEMLSHILENKISKQAITDWAKQTPADGRIIALASYIMAYPEEGDLPRLLEVAKSAVWLHVKYRVTLALRQLRKLNFGQPSDWKKASEIISLYRAHAEERKDFSLLTLTEELQKLLQSKAQ